MKVRLEQREAPPTEFKNSMAAQSVDAVKGEVQELLLSEGYHPIVYSSGEIKAVAYGKTGFSFGQEREEPILIDDGGVIVEGLPVLKIALRDIDGTNEILHEKVIGILKKYGITDYQTSKEGARVYALKRV